MTIGDAISIAAVCAMAAFALSRGHDLLASGVFVMGTLSVIVPDAVGHMVEWLLP